MDRDLLRPTIAANGQARSLYGTRAFYICSFFGGPVAALIYGGANSSRLGRLRRDVPVLLSLLVSYPLVLAALQRFHVLEWMGTQVGRPNNNVTPITVRILGLFYFGAAYLMHRAEYRAARATGVEALPGATLGFAAFAIGLASNIALAFALLQK